MGIDWRRRLGVRRKNHREGLGHDRRIAARLRSHAKRLRQAISRWVAGELDHQACEFEIDRLECQYEGVPEPLWDNDPALARSLLVEHREAMRSTLIALDAIEDLRRRGYHGDAPGEGKRHTLWRHEQRGSWGTADAERGADHPTGS